MLISFRLRELLQKRQVKERGMINDICQHTGLERHQVSALLNNRVQYVSLETLGRISDYLVEHYQYDPRDLPGLLLGRDPENFWSLLVGRQWLDLCLGVRYEESGSEVAWVIASDAYLHGKLLSGLTGLSGTLVEGVPRPANQHLELHLVRAPNRKGDITLSRPEGELIYRDFLARKEESALISLGSQKVNPLAELTFATTFGLPPFETQPVPATPQLQPCPFLFRYRPRDPKPPSCCAHVQLAQAGCSLTAPGIYYETADGEWACCSCDDARGDAALVFYAYRPTLGRLEMVLGGFSGRATQWLALELRNLGGRLWPPSYQSPDLVVGIFIVDFRFDHAPEAHATTKGLPAPDHVDVIPVPKEALERRLNR